MAQETMPTIADPLILLRYQQDRGNDRMRVAIANRHGPMRVFDSVLLNSELHPWRAFAGRQLYCTTFRNAEEAIRPRKNQKADRRPKIDRFAHRKGGRKERI